MMKRYGKEDKLRRAFWIDGSIPISTPRCKDRRLIYGDRITEVQTRFRGSNIVTALAINSVTEVQSWIKSKLQG